MSMNYFLCFVSSFVSVCICRVMQVDSRWTEVFNETAHREETSVGPSTPRSQPLTIRNSYRLLFTSLLDFFSFFTNQLLNQNQSTWWCATNAVSNTHTFVSYSSKAEFRPSSMPSIPNPFPELCSPSHSPVRVGSLAGSTMPTDEDTHVRIRMPFCFYLFFKSRLAGLH